CFSVKASWIAWSLPPLSSPSTVLTLQPSAWTASTVHDLTGCPSSSTVQTPQCDVSQPMCVPVSRSSSRMKCTSSRRDSTSASCAAPFTVTLILCFISLSSRTLERRFQGARGQHARHLALVLDRSAPVGARLGRGGRKPGRFGDVLLVGRLAFQEARALDGFDGRRPRIGERNAGALHRAPRVQRHLHRRRRRGVVAGLAL